MGILDFLPSPPDITSLVPAPIASFTGMGEQPAPAYNQQLPSYRAQLTSKYTDLGADYATLPPEAQNALLNYDAGRIARGRPPLTREESLGAIQTIRTGKPATPAPDRSPLNFLGNAISDIGDIVKSVPRLPAAMVQEVLKIPQAGQYIADATASGQNGLQAFLGAPGIRLIPGAYTAKNLAGGATGVKEALSHPVMSLLDVLPAAEGLARTTAVGSEAARIAEEAGRPAHALQALATRKIGEEGALVPNRLGEMTSYIQHNTKPGIGLDQIGGKISRDAYRLKGIIDSRIHNTLAGVEPATAVEEQIARDVQGLAAKYKFDEATAADTYHRLELDNWHDATPEQLAYKADYQELRKRQADVGISQGEFAHIYNPRNPDQAELLPIKQAKEVRRTRMAAEHVNRMVERRYRAIHGSARTLDEIAADADSLLKDSQLSQAKKRVEFRAITHELDAMGYDSSPLLKSLNQQASRHGDNLTAFRDSLEKLRTANPTPVSRHSSADLISLFDKYGRAGNKQADRLVQAIKSDNTGKILEALKNMERAKTKIPELADDPNLAESIRSLQSRKKFDAKMEGTGYYTEREAAKRTRAADKAIDTNIPARFIPKVQDLANQKLTELFTAKAATPEQAALVAEKVLNRQWSRLDGYVAGDTEDLVGKTVEDIAKTWRSIQEEGLDPEFVHHITPQQARQTLRPTISEVPNTISQMKERSLFASPQHLDASVSLSHAANERVTRMGAEEWIDQIARANGIKEQELRAASQTRVDRYLERNPSHNRDAAFEAVMSKTHTPFDPATAGYNWDSPRLKDLQNERLWIPKALANNLKAMHDPKGLLGGAVDPLTKAFRVSVIGLSPRTQLYNIMGGATMTMGEIGPAGLIKYMKTGMEYARNPEAMLADERISGAVRAIVGSEKELLADMDRTRFTGRVGDAAEFMKGATLGRVWQQIQEAKALQAVKNGVGTVAKKSYDLNGLFDDAYKITSYLYQHDKQLTKGLSKEAAERAGLELLRKTQPDWHAMTPIERNLMKSVFPFYGFMSHSLRYVFRYPMDHPLRANVLASFSRAEQADNATLPGNFLSNLFITGQNSNGRATALSLAALNPFGDVANTLTLAGFLSATNPAIQTALESVGLQRGQAELYPTLRYDPESGRLVGVHKNPLQNLIENTVPQSQIASALLGANQDFKDRLHDDPWSAYRTMMSAGGIPILWRGLNTNVEATKAEVAREKSARAVLTNAQKSGDWSEANRYPSLRAYFDQAKSLTPEQTAPYTPRPDEEQQLKDAVRNGTSAAVPVTGPPIPPPPRTPVAPVANTGGF